MERELPNLHTVSNSHTVSLIQEKLPELISQEWSKEVNKKDSLVDEFDKFPHFLKVLLKQRRVIEYSSSDLCTAKSQSRGYASSVQLGGTDTFFPLCFFWAWRY